jgi:hypothetical protein
MDFAKTTPSNLGKMKKEDILSMRNAVAASLADLNRKMKDNSGYKQQIAALVPAMQEKLRAEEREFVQANLNIIFPKTKGTPFTQTIKTFSDLVNYADSELFAASRDYATLNESCIMTNYDNKGFFTDPCFIFKKSLDEKCYVKPDQVLKTQFPPVYKC